MTPRATYRLQFSGKFTFDDAAKVTPYLASLGISHLYASPWLTARPGSTHRYDVIDYGRIDEELGGESGFARLTEALRANGIGHIVDFVPNHMGVGYADNQLWLSVLEWGPLSPYAEWFDIDWEPGKILVPMLGAQYGVELEKGVFELKFDAEEGSFSVWAYDTHRLPICPTTYPLILGSKYERLGDSFAHARNPEEAAALKAELREISGIDLSKIDLHRLIEQQHWRPAHFRVAADDINYRRFFNINELAGIRMESPQVFEQAHRLVFDLIRSGMLQGLRIDHVDGLLNPKDYLDRLRERGEQTYVVVEKILAPHESLRQDWPVQGTTGYDFCAEATQLLIDPAGEQELTRTYQEFTGERRGFIEVLRESKLYILRNELAGELELVARKAVGIARQNPKTRDFTQNVLSRALEAIIGAFPVYRTYVDLRGAGEQDRRDLQWAVEQARAQELEIDPSVFDFLFQLLSGDLVEQPHSGYSRTDVIACAMRFQQYTGPVMAKGLEDTALYRYVRLLALNEVGSRPDRFGISSSNFHRANVERQKYWPATMLTTSTHDTKLGEDVRARLVTLSEIPDEWDRQIHAWSRLLRAAIGGVDGDAPPHRNDEYLLYQLLLGTWTAPNETYENRVKQAMLKAMREAKVHTSWIAVNAEYEGSVLSFVERLFTNSAFLSKFEPFQQQIAAWGWQNSLVLAVLKLTSPGVPDIYQGSELENFRLMDPDNREPVDFGALDGPKARLTSHLLHYRCEHPRLFAEGSYQAVATTGELADCVVAFQRELDDHALLVACARFPARRAREAWGSTRVEIEGVWRDLFSREVCPSLQAEDLFRDTPYAVLERQAV